MYKKVSTDMNFVGRELETLAYWQEHGIAQKVEERNPEGPNFTLYDGPPTANGKPHIGHILTRAIKDIIPRYKRMKGYRVSFKAGWDTHGLPVELEVEKALNINGKPQIESYGLEPFIQKCKESVWKYKDEWEAISQRVAYSADMKNPYVTYDNNFIESEWWALKKIWEKGLLYEGYKIVPYCPRCGTSLASHEVAQGYKDVKETSVFVRFAVKGEENTWFAAWTTTPWTLPSNVALCVNPDAEYALVDVVIKPDEASSCGCGGACVCGSTCHHDEHSDHNKKGGEKQESRGSLKLDETQSGKYWVAKDLVAQLFGAQATILETCSGKELERKAYLPLFDYAQKTVVSSGKEAFYVTCADYVTLSDGTGIVHIAPAFGEDDAQVGRVYDLPFVQLVRDDGTLHEDVVDFAGIFCKDADKDIIRKMGKEASLLAAIPFEHSYPFCWRCDTPLIYYARHSWFIRMSELREQLVHNNRQVNWVPENVREGRFGNFIANAVDWGLSRERYWGTPLPVWRCESCNKLHVIGSIAELKEMSADCPENIELHKPYIDRVHISCPHCSGQMTRVSEVIDCWFDSGAMPFAQYHYPFENKELFEQNFPAQFISEAQDQTRGWFYSLMAISTLIFEQNPYENVIVLGLVQDKDGIKMSKHKGNVISPQDAIDKHGSDAVRWYFYTNSNPWLPSRFSFDSVAEGQRRFLGTLWNTYAFYILYASIDRFDPTQYSLDYKNLPVMDRWILSRLQTLIAKVSEGLDQYDITVSARALQEFVDDLSNWYVRRCRDRFWGEGMPQDKVNAFKTLHTVLETLTRMIAPFVPFIADQMYANLVLSVDEKALPSVHLCDYPLYQEDWVDAELEKVMAEVLRLVSLGRAARNEANVKNRQPLAQMFVVTDEELNEEYSALVADELNIQKLVYLKDASELVSRKFKPQLKTLGRRFGAKINELRTKLENLDSQAAWEELQEKGRLTLELAGEMVELAKEDLLIETLQKEGLAAQQDRDRTIALDLNLTPELVDAGLVRELISKIQTMRKESGFEVEDHIHVHFNTGDTLTRIFNEFNEAIASETLADAIHASDSKEGKIWTINGESCIIHVEKI